MLAVKCSATVIFLLTIVVISGCAKKPVTTVIKQNSALHIQRLMILPFVTESDEKRFEVAASQICQNQCYQHGFEIVNYGDFRTFLQRKRLLLAQFTKEGTPQLFAELARELQVDALVKGKILAVNYKQVQGESIPEISLQLDLIRATDGKLLANTFLTGYGDNYRTLMRFGVLRTSTQLLSQMIDDILNNWYEKGVFQ